MIKIQLLCIVWVMLGAFQFGCKLPKSASHKIECSEFTGYMVRHYSRHLGWHIEYTVFCEHYEDVEKVISDSLVRAYLPGLYDLSSRLPGLSYELYSVDELQHMNYDFESHFSHCKLDSSVYTVWPNIRKNLSEKVFECYHISKVKFSGIVAKHLISDGYLYIPRIDLNRVLIYDKESLTFETNCHSIVLNCKWFNY